MPAIEGSTRGLQDRAHEIMEVAYCDRPVKAVALLGSTEPVKFTRTDAALEVTLPTAKPCDYAYALRIE